MKTKTIEVVVDPAGKTSIRTNGFTGPACREASRSLEQALGLRTNEQLTGEFYQSTESKQTNQQKA